MEFKIKKSDRIKSTILIIGIILIGTITYADLYGREGLSGKVVIGLILIVLSVFNLRKTNMKITLNESTLYIQKKYLFFLTINREKNLFYEKDGRKVIPLTYSNLDQSYEKLKGNRFKVYEFLYNDEGESIIEYLKNNYNVQFIKTY